MKKSLIWNLIVVVLLILTPFSFVVNARSSNYIYETSEKFFDYIKSNENETKLITSGPLSPLLNITKIALLNGSSSAIEKIERILHNRILHFVLPVFFIQCNDLDFSVSYLKTVPFFIPFIRHFSYYTTLYKDQNFPFNNDSIFGKRHTLVVNGFNGYFIFHRMKPLKGFPAFFSFSGTYNEVTIIR